MTDPTSTAEKPTPRSRDLERVLAILRRRAGVIVLCVVVTAGAAFGLSVLQQKQYSTSASLLFRNPGFAEDLFGASATAVNPDPTREAATNQRLVGLEVVSQLTAKHLKGVSAGEVSNMVNATSDGEAELVSVTATSSSPAQARLVANTFARQFIAFRARTDKSKLLLAKRLAERGFKALPPDQEGGVRGRALSSSAAKLGILASLQTGNAELVQPAGLPSVPSSPRPLRNTFLGAVLGLLLGLGIAFLYERLNRQLRDPEEARDVFGMPMLGTVPESKTIMASNEGLAPELPFLENEAFRTLRASLRYFNVDHEMRSILVTSYSAGVGKSTVAWNLARVAASSSNVVLLETDLRNPSLASQHGLSVGPGLAEVLTHQVDLDEAIQTKALPNRANGAENAGSGLDVVVAGSNPPNPAELIESQAMTDVLSQLVERYDLVVIDTAPAGVVSDVFPLLQKVDGVVAVARIGQSTRDELEQLREQLASLEAPVLGIVANAVKLRRGAKYGYGYYGYGPAPDQSDTMAVGAGSSSKSDA